MQERYLTTDQPLLLIVSSFHTEITCPANEKVTPAVEIPSWTEKLQDLGGIMVELKSLQAPGLLTH